MDADEDYGLPPVGFLMPELENALTSNEYFTSDPRDTATAVYQQSYLSTDETFVCPAARTELTELLSDCTSQEEDNEDDECVGVWVLCGDCRKWRYVPEEITTDRRWTCDMNRDGRFSSCETPAQDFYTENQEDYLRYKHFQEGSLVWAKVRSYPFWPAMVQKDPDSDSCYRATKDQFHVVFFGQVSRSWIGSRYVLPFTGFPDVDDFIPTQANMKKARSDGIQDARKEALDSLKLTLEERIIKFDFLSYYEEKQKRSGKKRKSSKPSSVSTASEASSVSPRTLKLPKKITTGDVSASERDTQFTRPSRDADIDIPQPRAGVTDTTMSRNITKITTLKTEIVHEKPNERLTEALDIKQEPIEFEFNACQSFHINELLGGAGNIHISCMGSDMDSGVLCPDASACTSQHSDVLDSMSAEEDSEEEHEQVKHIRMKFWRTGRVQKKEESEDGEDTGEWKLSISDEEDSAPENDDNSDQVSRGLSTPVKDDTTEHISRCSRLIHKEAETSEETNEDDTLSETVDDIFAPPKTNKNSSPDLNKNTKPRESGVRAKEKEKEGYFEDNLKDWSNIPAILSKVNKLFNDPELLHLSSDENHRTQDGNSSSAESETDSELYDETDEESDDDDTEIEEYDRNESTYEHFPGEIRLYCPICSGNMALCRMEEIKIHVFSEHLPWYFSVKQNHLATPLSEKLHPILQRMDKIPNPFIIIWGKLLHGFLVHLRELLPSSAGVEDLVDYVRKLQLYPTGDALDEARIVWTEEQAMLVTAHETFTGMKVEEEDLEDLTLFSPPENPTGLLHWVTLANIIRALPEENRTDLVGYEILPADRLYEHDVIRQDLTQASRMAIADKLWESIDASKLSDMLDFIKILDNLTDIKHPYSGEGLVRYTLNKQMYLTARILLFAGAKIDETDAAGNTALVDAAKKEDSEAVKILHLWKSGFHTDELLLSVEAVNHSKTVDNTSSAENVYGPSKNTPEEEERGTQNSAETDCKICSRTFSQVSELKAHFVQTHLPWYFRVTSITIPDTELSAKLKPALEACILSKRFGIFNQLWGRLLDGFLRKVSTCVGHQMLVHQYMYVRKSSDYLTNVEACMVNALTAYMETDDFTPHPSRYTPALLHWKSLMDVMALKRDITSEFVTYERFVTVSELMDTTISTADANIPAEYLPAMRNYGFLKAVYDEDIEHMWAEINSMPGLVYHLVFEGKLTPLQYALTYQRLLSAHLLLFMGADVEATGEVHLTPLCQAVVNNNECTVKLLLPWVKKKHIREAMGICTVKNQQEMLSLLKTVIGNREVSSGNQEIEDVDDEQSCFSISRRTIKHLIVEPRAERYIPGPIACYHVANDSVVDKSDDDVDVTNTDENNAGGVEGHGNAIDVTETLSNNGDVTEIRSDDNDEAQKCESPSKVDLKLVRESSKESLSETECPTNSMAGRADLDEEETVTMPEVLHSANIDITPIDLLPRPGITAAVKEDCCPVEVGTTVCVNESRPSPVRAVKRPVFISPIKAPQGIAKSRRLESAGEAEVMEDSVTRTKSTHLKGKSVASKGKCAICQENMLLLLLKKHCMVKHFPWYMSLTSTSASQSENKLQRLYGDLFIECVSANEPLPESVALTLGKLLDGLLRFLASQLGFENCKNLLTYVRECRWKIEFKLEESDMKITRAYKQYCGEEGGDVTFSPPEEVAGLLHWQTIMYLIGKLEKKVQEEIKMFEKYTPRKGYLPTSRGMQAFPEIETRKTVTTIERNDFTTAIGERNMHKANSMLAVNPSLLQITEKNQTGLVTLITQDTEFDRRSRAILQLLLLNNININQQDADGCTALHHATQRGDSEAVDFLLTWGADVDVKNNKDENVFHCAAGKWNIRDKLESHVREKIQEKEKLRETMWRGAQADQKLNKPRPKLRYNRPQLDLDICDLETFGMSSTPSGQDYAVARTREDSPLSSSNQISPSSSVSILKRNADEDPSTKTSSQPKSKRRLITVENPAASSTGSTPWSSSAFNTQTRSQFSPGDIVTVSPPLSDVEFAAVPDIMDCPVCDKKDKWPALKQHVLHRHLPWYFSVRLVTDGRRKPSKLAKKLIPVYEKLVGEPIESYPFQIYIALLGRLIDGMLGKIIGFMDIDNVVELTDYVNRNQLYPKFNELQKIDEDVNLVMCAYRAFKENLRPSHQLEVTIAPARSVYSILHWYTMAKLMSTLSSSERDELKAYEKYSSSTLLERRETGTQRISADFLRTAIDQEDFNYTLKLITEHSYLVNKTLSDGSTPLEVVLRLGHHETATLMLLGGARIDTTNQKGHTALQVMAETDRAAAVQLLLSWDPSFSQQKLAYMAAKAKGNGTVCMILEEHNPRVSTKKRPHIEEYATCSSSEYSDNSPELKRKRGTSERQNKKEYDVDQSCDLRELITNSPAHAIFSSSPILSLRSKLTTDRSDDDRSLTENRRVVSKGDPEAAFRYNGSPEPNVNAEQTTCPVCKISFPPSVIKLHATEHHLPWFIGSANLPPPGEGRNTTNLCRQISESLHLAAVREQNVTSPLLEVWGQLLDGLLLFLVKKLSLGNKDYLLDFAREHKLWVTPGRDEDAELLPGIYRDFWSKDKKTKNLTKPENETKDELKFSPPSTVSCLLYWRTLLNIISYLPKDDQLDALVHEAFVWCKDNPTLPTPGGQTYEAATGDIGIVLNKRRETVFIKALTQNHKTALAMLKERPESVRSVGENGTGVVYHSLLLNSDIASAMDMTRKLLLLGAHVDKRDADGDTVLHHAVRQQKAELVDFLLKWNANTYLQNRDGETPIRLAASLPDIFDICQRAAIQTRDTHERNKATLSFSSTVTSYTPTTERGTSVMARLGSVVTNLNPGTRAQRTLTAIEGHRLAPMVTMRDPHPLAMIGTSASGGVLRPPLMATPGPGLSLPRHAMAATLAAPTVRRISGEKIVPVRFNTRGRLDRPCAPDDISMTLDIAKEMRHSPIKAPHNVDINLGQSSNDIHVRPNCIDAMPIPTLDDIIKRKKVKKGRPSSIVLKVVPTDPSNCLICDDKDVKGWRKHYLQYHLPWYVCVDKSTDSLILQERDTPMSRLVRKALYTEKRNYYNVPAFKMIIGELLHNLLQFVKQGLGLSNDDGLNDYVNNLSDDTTASITSQTISPMDMRSVRAHQAFLGASCKTLVMKPPNCVSVLVHWKWLAILLSRLPTDIQRAALRHEQYTLPAVSLKSEWKEGRTRQKVTRTKAATFFGDLPSCDPYNVCSRLNQCPALGRQRDPETGLDALTGVLLRQRYSIAVLLYLYSAPVNAVDEKGWTSLHHVTYGGVTNAVKLLLDMGADKGLTTNDGSSAKDLAEERGHKYIASLLN